MSGLKKHVGWDALQDMYRTDAYIDAIGGFGVIGSDDWLSLVDWHVEEVT